MTNATTDQMFKAAYNDKKAKWMNDLSKSMLETYSVPKDQFYKIMETVGRSFYLSGRIDEAKMWTKR